MNNQMAESINYIIPLLLRYRPTSIHAASVSMYTGLFDMSAYAVTDNVFGIRTNQVSATRASRFSFEPA